MHVFKKRKEKNNNNSSLPCNKQMGDRKRYREYHRSGDAKIPRTAWRFKKKQKQSFDGATTAAAEDSGMLNHIG